MMKNGDPGDVVSDGMSVSICGLDDIHFIFAGESEDLDEREEEREREEEMDREEGE
jgi:hypothetical protein